MDIPEVLKVFESKKKALEQYKSAVAKQQTTEPNHLEALMIKEKEFAEEDNMPLDEGELTEIMNKHKENSPFALDVAQAQSKLTGAMKG